MAFNGSGTFNLAAGNPVTTGTTISSTWANSTLSDVATGLTNCITRDGQSTPLANIPMGNYKLTGLGQAASTGDALAWGKNASVVDLAASGAVSGTGFSTYLASPPAIGSTTASTGAFTTLSASSTVSGTGFSTYLASPPAIGSTTASTGAFTTLSASSTVSGTGFSNYLASPPAIGSTTASTGAFTTLSASSTVTLSGGTANGVGYLNASKVFTTGSALTFDGTHLGVGTTNYLGKVSVGVSDAGGEDGFYFSYGTSRVGSFTVNSNTGEVKIGATNTIGSFFNTFYANNSEQMRLTSTGLGIGTSSPGEKLQITATTSQSGIKINNNNATAFVGAAYASGDYATGALAGDMVLRSASRIALSSNGGSSVQVVLDSSGNLLVNLTSGWGPKFITQNAGDCIGAQVTSNNNNSTFIGRNTSSSATFYVLGTGQIYSTATSIIAISDQTLKENIRNLETGLSEVMALKPRRFDWKSGEGTDTKDVAGFIAQEVEQVLPELVTDYQYSEGVTKKSLKMGDILPTLVKAIQEQQALITQLQADIATLKGK